MKMNLHEGWVKGDVRWRKEIVFSGHGYCIFPGIPNEWDIDFERVLKSLAYTSERGIDWNCKHIMERCGLHVFRGIVLEVDPWIYDVLQSTRSLPVRSVWIVS